MRVGPQEASISVVQESRMETTEKSRIVSSPSVTLLRVKLEVLHDVTEGLFVLDDPDDRGKHTASQTFMTSLGRFMTLSANSL